MEVTPLAQKIKEQLLEWDSPSIGWRFQPSSYECPQCNKKALMDNWPPNYWGSNSYYGEDGNEYESYSMGGVKHVCLDCKIAFEIDHYEKLVDGKQTEFRNEILQITPLVKRGDGKLLTPHDVWREDYKDKHGEYPVEVYV